MTLAEWLAKPADCPQGRSADCVAQIAFLPEAESGRSHPVKSDYRPIHDFGLADGFLGARHDYANGGAWIYPGEAAYARLTFNSPELLQPLLKVGTEFTVQDGARVVARGTIVCVLNEHLQR